MKFAVACLLAVSARDTQNVWELRSVLGHRVDAGHDVDTFNHTVKKANAKAKDAPYRSSFVQADSSESSSSEESSDDENVQLQKAGPDLVPGLDGQLGAGTYKRENPAFFSADTDDVFMRSVIKNYAVETTECDDKGNNCVKTGHFWLRESDAKALAREVAATHKGISDAEYFAAYWQKAWGHFDVNRIGRIEAIKAPQLMRFFLSDQYLQLGESG